jgi:uncharacterized membrane protein
MMEMRVDATELHSDLQKVDDFCKDKRSRALCRGALVDIARKYDISIDPFASTIDICSKLGPALRSKFAQAFGLSKFSF